MSTLLEMFLNGQAMTKPSENYMKPISDYIISAKYVFKNAEAGLE